MRFTIFERLTFGYLVIMLLVVFLGGYVSLKLNQLLRLTQSVAAAEEEMIRPIENLLDMVFSQVGFEKKYVISKDPDFYGRFLELEDQVTKALEDLEGFTATGTEENLIFQAMDLKDNLLNLLRYQKGMELFGGCAGYGCSAAFNFMAVLSDGEAHACRKFPSLIGNVFKQSISEIYDSEIARRYRSGCRAKECQSCPIRPVCGGCLAIAHSFGLNVFEERDPYCFMNRVGITS